jgi:hypothetical protein
MANRLHPSPRKIATELQYQVKPCRPPLVAEKREREECFSETSPQRYQKTDAFNILMFNTVNVFCMMLGISSRHI